MSMYTVEEIAMTYSVSQETVRRWIRSGKLKSTINSRKEGNLVDELDLVEFFKTKPKYRVKVGYTTDRTKRKDLMMVLEYLWQERDRLDAEIQRIQQLLEEESQ